MGALERWRFDQDEYLRCKAVYDDRVQECAKLKQFVRRTVSHDILTECCDPQANIREWYAKISGKFWVMAEEWRQEEGK
jgi:hypothetical protein